MKKFLILITACSVLVLGVNTVYGQEKYPQRAIELVVPWAAGGSSDAAGRIISNELSKDLKIPVTVLNKPGGGSVIGATHVHNAAKDGYTLLLGSPGNLIAAAIVEGVPFNFRTDFVPLTVFASNPYVIFVRSDSPFRTLEDLIDKAKKNPGLVSSGTTVNSDTWFNQKMLETAAGVQFNSVPLKGGSEGPPAILGGHIDVSIGILTASLPFARAGQIRFLASTGTTRLKEFPDVPTLKEKGFTQTFIDGNWNGIFVARGTPSHVIDTLISASEKVRQNEGVAANLEKVGNFIDAVSTADFRKRVESEMTVIELISKELGLKGKK